MSPTLRQKLGLSTAKRCILINAPGYAANAIGLAEDDRVKRLSGQFDYIHLFTSSLSHLETKLKTLKGYLGDKGSLWVSWPKAQRHRTGITLRDVIRLSYDAGLVESKAVAFDEVWSAIKLTFPKPGKVYRNSYGRLPENKP